MDFEVAAEGLAFPEGPVALADGTVLLVEMRRQTLSRVLPDGRVEVVAQLGGGPNGVALGPDGAAYVCNNGGRFYLDGSRPQGPHGGAPPEHVGGSIQRVDLASGAASTLYESCGERRLLAPNDLVFDREGGFWFTDHGRADAQGLKYGALFYARPDGSQIRLALDYLFSPNGVGLSPDERTLYLADTRTARVWAFPLAAPGELADPAAARVLGVMPRQELLDSLAVMENGQVCVATMMSGGLAIFGDEGLVEHILAPDPAVTNICFGGADMRDAWITAAGTGRLLRARWPAAGLALNFPQ